MSQERVAVAERPDGGGVERLELGPRDRRPFLLLMSVLLSTAFVAWNLVVEGPFVWHMTRSSAVQGAIEVVCLWAVLSLILARCAASRWRFIWLLLPSAIYLRRHHVDAPALLAVVYLEFILASGSLVLAQGRARYFSRRSWLEQLIAGLALWSAALWVLQLVDFGQPRAARILFALCVVPVLLAARLRPLSFTVLESAYRGSIQSRVIAAAALAFTCALFARTNVFAGHDALWYGFRPEQVLVATGSAFDSLGLVSPVYYFPKVYEILLLPLSAMDDFSFVGCFGVLVSALVCLLAYRLLRRHSVPTAFASIITLALFTTPALANTALAPKPDVLAALGILAMGWHASMSRGRGGGYHVGLVVGWAGLVAVSKLNLLPYVAAIGLLSVWLAYGGIRSFGKEFLAGASRLVPTLVLLVFVGAVATFRTWAVAGMPTVAPEQLVSIWRWLGFEFLLPVGTLDWVNPQDWNDVPALVFDWLYRPARLPHVIVTWAGNLWFALPLAAVLFPTLRARPPFKLPIVELLIAAVGVAMLVGVRYHFRGSDGNYFIAPIAAGLILAALLVHRRLGRHVQDRWVLIPIAAAIAFQAYYSFVSAGWGMPGTRRLDAHFSRSAWDTRFTRAEQLREQGLASIGAFLQQNTNRRWHVIGDAPEPGAFWLPARYESVQTISYSRPELIADASSLSLFIACAKVDAVIVSAGTHLDGVMARMPLGDALASDKQFRLIDVRPVGRADADCEGYSAVARTSTDAR